jgi:competence protein ComEA
MIRRLIVAAALTAAIGVVGAPVLAQQTAGQTGAAQQATQLNLNTAKAADLEKLPGIGAATAARIIEYREQNGPFTKVEDLMNVRGIGEKTFLKLKPLVMVAPPKLIAR